MYPGYMAIGTDDPFLTVNAQSTEIVNNMRAYAYAEQGGICWLERCDECETIAHILPTFTAPEIDNAPWYTPDDPDSIGFYGVVGLAVEGADSSTRQSTVKMALTGGGVIGPSYEGPRTLVIRALAVAADDCSLSYGIRWLNEQYQTSRDPCTGDTLTFFECCPCICPEELENDPDQCWITTYAELTLGPDCARTLCSATNYIELTAAPSCAEGCWATNYTQLAAGPSCAAGCWADTYQQLRVGVNCSSEIDDCWVINYAELRSGPDCLDTDVWCIWPQTYSQLKFGPPGWSCCYAQCVVPEMRQFHNTRVTSGPTVLSRPLMNSQGAVAEIEFTVVAADPKPYGMPFLTPLVELTSTEPVPAEMSAPVDTNPFKLYRPPTIGGVALLERPVVTAEVAWVRGDTVIAASPSGQYMESIRPIVRIGTTDATGPLRLGLWMGESRLAGWTLQDLPANATVTIDGSASRGDIDGVSYNLSGVVRDWDGGFPKQVLLPFGDYTLTLDQYEGQAVPVMAGMALVPV